MTGSYVDNSDMNHYAVGASKFNIKYIVNYDDKAVTAIAKVEYTHVDSSIRATFFNSELDSEICAVARCKDEDKFDVELGKKIARRKLLRKFFHMERKHIIDNIQDAQKFIEFNMSRLEHIQKKYDKVVNKLVNHYE